MTSTHKKEIDRLEREKNWMGLSSYIYFLSLNDDDSDFAFKTCYFFSQHENENVRGMAILGFGHIAQKHDRIDLETVLPIIEKAKLDKSEFVRHKANDATDDLEFLIKT